MPVPKPRPNESKDSFVSRCASQLASTDPGRPNEQRVAMCFSSWRDAKGQATLKDTIILNSAEADLNESRRPKT